jgi:hypothetical protein
MTASDRDIAATMRARVAADIEQAGWSMIGVFPSTEGAAVPTYFCYTVGLWERFRQPEIAVFGLSPHIANGVLWGAYHEYLEKGERFTDGEVVTERLVEGGFPVAFRSMPNDLDDCPFSAAHAYYGTWDFPVLQMVLSDPNRLFPWQDGCEEDMVTMQQIPIRLQSAEA